MVTAVKGVLLTVYGVLDAPAMRMGSRTRYPVVRSDPAVKEYILHVERQEIASGNNRFVIQDLDATHLFIDASYVKFVQEKLDELMDRNAFVHP